MRRCARKGDLDLLGSKKSCSSCLERWASSRPLWDAVLQPELLASAEELVWADALLDDPAFFVPLTPFLDSTIGRVVDSDDGHSASQPAIGMQ